MKDNKIDNLLKKYLEGNTTLPEENVLFSSNEQADPSFKDWSSFVNNQKIDPEQDFNDRLWSNFNKRTNKKGKLTTLILSSVASIIIVMTFITLNSNDQKLSYAEKEILLNQAKKMVSSIDPPIKSENIIYENELVVVYIIKE